MRRMMALFSVCAVFGFLPLIAGCGTNSSVAGQPTVITPPNDPNLAKIKPLKREAAMVTTNPSNP